MLCGWDPLTQRSYEYRKAWLQQRLIFLASVMAIDIEGFCIMANHLHLIVRNRPDVAGKWSPEQIARKWLQLCPPYKPGTREVAETPSQADLDAILNNPARVEQLRLRLSNPSWLMRFVTEKLARVANREERTTGRFWEAYATRGHPMLEATSLFVASLILDGVYGVLRESASSAV